MHCSAPALAARRAARSWRSLPPATRGTGPWGGSIFPPAWPPDGGLPEGPVVRADVTTTFAALKRGLVTGVGLDWVGRVVVVDIGIPDEELRRDVMTFALEAADVARHLPSRPRNTHKGTYGRLLIVAGSVGKTGAAALAARAAMRSGAGLVTVATPPRPQPIVAPLLLAATPG